MINTTAICKIEGTTTFRTLEVENVTMLHHMLVDLIATDKFESVRVLLSYKDDWSGYMDEMLRFDFLYDLDIKENYRRYTLYNPIWFRKGCIIIEYK